MLNEAASRTFPNRDAEPLLNASALSKWVETADGQLDILTSVDLVINRGETVAIVGASGSGKSTLLGLLAGLDLPSSGSVRIGDELVTELSEDGRADLRRRLIGFVFQSFHLIPTLTALENAMLPLELAGDPDPRRGAMNILDRVGLAQRWRHYPRQLSGGEQQRVALARAFVTRPSILFADEPTGNLDRRTGQTVIDLLFELNAEQQTTLILVTHDEALASRCERTVRLEAGSIVDA